MSNSLLLLNKMLDVGTVLKIDNANHSISIIPMKSVELTDDVRLVFTISDLMSIFDDFLRRETIVDIINREMPLLKI